jgi:hypothetical protein
VAGRHPFETVVSAGPAPDFRGVSVNPFEFVVSSMDGADRFMFWAVVLVFLAIFLGFAVTILVG